MEWCLNCHRNPAKNLRPTSEIYNMAWEGPSSDKPVWCAATGKDGPTAQSVSCTVIDPRAEGCGVKTGIATRAASPNAAQNFTSQMDLGKYLTAQYHIRPPNELTSCETCHR